ncbi:hypothetical protein LAJ19_21460 (plasmid) [Deinococcus taeanensis]|uniref:hypothetical protein n=1 Tax=Deinococcus taeanensis TaxID=2737050 RepID=UPI001CDD1961|nr:hypothetical protein [Deinococcus taeanensis]UBV45553.1 hypothetical protein LAJ19_21460 [Deinococcus taeanensis]
MTDPTLNQSAPRRNSAQSNLRLVKQALAFLAEQQVHLPPSKRNLRVSNVIATVRQFDPDARMHRSIFTRNPEARRLLAEAQDRDLTAELTPDFSKFTKWPPPRRFTTRAIRARKKKYVSRETQHKALAEYVVYLEEQEQYLLRRRQQFEAIGWVSGPWPTSQVYPDDEFVPSSDVQRRYQHYWNSRQEFLARKAIRLEGMIAEHRSHLENLDFAMLREDVMSLQ